MKPHKSVIAVLLCSILAFPIVARAEPGDATHSVKPAASDETSDECHAMAKIFEVTICREQLVPYQFDKARYASPNAKIDPDEIMRQRTLLRRAIWQIALTHKFGDKASPPTLEEIDKFRKGFDTSMDESYEADVKTSDYLKSMLDKYNYAPKDEKQIKQLLEATQMSLKLYSERQQHTHGLPKEYQFVVDTAERGIARNMLTTWKGDKILYETYHGRIAVVANGNVVPADAYREFLKYIEGDGKLKVLDPHFDNVMEDTKNLVTSINQYLPPSDPIARQYFTRPDWQFSLANTPSRFADLRSQLAKIPNLGPKPGASVSEEELIGKQSHPSLAPPPPTPDKQP